MSDRYVCIHGHFYQPPREDPLTDEMPVEADAAPYSNFNEKIYSECYAPNAELGNYAMMSFNFGPTLVAWMRRHHPATLQTIVASDRAAVASTGHGSAIAQSYHHTILPLASERDRRTEIRWGVRSFELLYGRRPLGIWLPETAVDTPTLEDCAAEGLRFTIFAPGQVDGNGYGSGAFVIELPSGREMVALVYDGELGGTVSFNPDATAVAEDFVARHVVPAFERVQTEPALVTIATDGEVYGHHHAFKDLFLRELLERALAANGLMRVTSEQFVMGHEITQRGALVERSSWGCPHALARWSTGCDCTPGSSAWKQPLRAAFDVVAEAVDAVYEDVGRDVLHDPWAARDAYVDVVDGAQEFGAWFASWRSSPRADARLARVLLEAQRHRLAMYASCAFYWEDVARIEPGYGIRRGLAASELIDRELGTSIAATFVEHLEHSRSGVTNRTAAELHAADWAPAHPR